MGLPLNEIQNCERVCVREGVSGGERIVPQGSRIIAEMKCPATHSSPFTATPLIIRLVNILPRMQSY